MNRRVRLVALWPAIGVMFASHFLTAQPCSAAKPVVVVEVVTNQLPDDFRPASVDVPASLKRGMELEAVARLQRPFPLFAWVPEHQSAALMRRDATLRLTVAKEPGVTWRIYLTAEIERPGVGAKPLAIAEPTLYADGEEYPYEDEIEQHALRRGRAALATLTELGTHPAWRTQFIGEIPLADDVLHASGMRKLLLLPLLASELEADDLESRFLAVLDTKPPGQPLQRGVFILTPNGPENGDRAQGKLECMVSGFRFAGVMHPNYVAECELVIAHRVKGSVVVRATNYVRGESSPVALSLDSSEVSP